MENTGYTSIADIGRLGRIPVNPSFSFYLPLVLGSAQSCQITLPIYLKL
jgi:hypothetical protein